MPDVTITTMPPSSDAVLRLPTELTIYTVAETRSAWLPWLTSQLSSKCGFATLLDPHGGRPASAGLGALSEQRADAALVNAGAVDQVDAAGVQLLASLALALTPRRLQLVAPSEPLRSACQTLGLQALLANDAANEAHA